VLVLFGGGVDPMPSYSDTWTWDGAAWTQLDASGPTGGGVGPALAPLGGKLVLVTGAELAVTDETWVFDGTLQHRSIREAWLMPSRPNRVRRAASSRVVRAGPSSGRTER
jgi:hypothetical protein